MVVASYEPGFACSNEGVKRLIEETLGFGLIRTLSLFQRRTIVLVTLQDGCGTQTALFVYRSFGSCARIELRGERVLVGLPRVLSSVA